MKPSITALLPMKHESERVPGKNYRDFGGRPLFMCILETLLSSRYLDRVCIDTDSPVIMDLVGHLDRVHVIPRPDALCGGAVPMTEVIAHDLTRIDGELFFQTHSTNPLLSLATIDAFIEAFLDNEVAFDSGFTVTLRKQRYWTRAGRPLNHDPGVLLNTQDLEGIYEENSCGYLFRKSNFLSTRSRIGQRPLLFETSPLESVDIDTEEDFTVALALLELFRNKREVIGR